MEQPIRILQVVTKMDRAGLETMLMNYYRHTDRSVIQFDFLVHRTERGAYDNEIESLGGRIYRLPRLVPWSLSYRKKLDDFFENHKEYRIVHVHQDCLSAIILKSAKKAGIPVRIAHSHSSNQDRNLKYPIKLFYRQFIPEYATHLFACGKAAGDWMFRGAPYTVIRNAIDADKYTFSPAASAEAKERNGLSGILTVGHIGRFDPAKNHTFILDIFRDIVSAVPDSRLLLIGDGRLKAETEEKARALGISGKVIFTGVRSDIPELLAAMDVFLFPSLYEGLPVTLAEAQAAGLPCVISDRVPAESIITADLVSVLPLSAPAEKWAEKVTSDSAKGRRNTYGDIAAAGFDIKENAAFLSNFYLSELKKCRH